MVVPLVYLESELLGGDAAKKRKKNSKKYSFKHNRQVTSKLPGTLLACGFNGCTTMLEFHQLIRSQDFMDKILDGLGKHERSVMVPAPPCLPLLAAQTIHQLLAWASSHVHSQRVNTPLNSHSQSTN